METLSFILELLNGTSSILVFFLLVWLSFHLYDRHSEDGIGIVASVLGMAGGVSLALYLYVEQAGLFLTRAVVFNWRINGAMYPFTFSQNIIFGLGAFMVSSGILLMIRLLSRPRFGEWPWVMTAAVTSLFVVIRTAIHYS